MNINFTARHFRAPDDLRDYVKDAVVRFEKSTSISLSMMYMQNHPRQTDLNQSKGVSIKFQVRLLKS